MTIISNNLLQEERYLKSIEVQGVAILGLFISSSKD
jgi:hypothetical protein